MLILIIIYLVFLILSIDLFYWENEMEYIYWKKSKNFMKGVSGYAKRHLYNKEYSIKTPVIVSFIPFINVLLYIIAIIHCMQFNYGTAERYKLESICNKKKGINSYIWKFWKPSEKWKKRYPIE